MLGFLRRKTMDNRNCNNCVYSTRDGFCRKFECAGTVTVEDIKAEARQSAIDEFIEKFIKRNQFKQMNKCECINAMYVLAEQLKEGENNAE